MIVSIVLSMFAVFTPKAVASENVILQDDFESYAVGTFPSAGGWQIVYNGLGDQYQVISTDYSHSPSKSLQLVGSYGWSVVAKKDFSSSSKIIGYEGYMMAAGSGSNAQSDFGTIGFYNGPIVQWGRYYARVSFQNGYLWASSSDGSPVKLTTFTPYTWYKIRVVLDKSNAEYNVWIDDVLVGQNLVVTHDPNEILSLQLAEGWQSVHCYFDDVKVFEVSGLDYAPGNLFAKPLEQSKVRLQWTSPSTSLYVQKYYIFRGTSPDFVVDWQKPLDQVNGNVYSYEDSISDNNIYYYRVVALFSDGFGKLTDPVACARPESFKGMKNTLTGIYTLAISQWYTFITFQQNFFVSTSDAAGVRKYYWCQNAVRKAMLSSTAFANAQMEIRGPVASITDTLSANAQWRKDWRQLGFKSPCPDEIDFMSYIDGSFLVMQNSLCSPQRFDLGLGSDAYIYTLSINYPPDSSVARAGFQSSPPNFVLVGEDGNHAVFTAGTGHVSCWTKVGDCWTNGRNIDVANNDRNKAAIITAETSEGLKWAASGDFNYQTTYTVDEGLFFVPDFSSIVVAPTIFQPILNLVKALVIETKCPVYLGVYDDSQRFIGFDATSGTVEDQIPTAVWRSNQSIVITNPSGTYRIVITGIESGTFALQIVWQDETGDITTLLDSTYAIKQGSSMSWILSPTTGGTYVVSMSRPTSVGGEWSPITMQTLTPANTRQMLALWISLISLMTLLATSFVYIRRRRRQS
jgi:hypothetical protein